MNSGWVKLHRQILTNEVFRHDRTAWHIFEVLLVICDGKTGKWSGGRFQLADLCNEKPVTTYKALKRLEKAKMVTLSSNTKYSEIRICKWADFQKDGNTKREQRSNNAVTTQEHSNKNKEIEVRNTTNVVLGETPKFGNEQINEMFAYWQEQVGYSIESNKQKNRYAVNNLLKKYGVENALRKVVSVSSTNLISTSSHAIRFRWQRMQRLLMPFTLSLRPLTSALTASESITVKCCLDCINRFHSHPNNNEKLFALSTNSIRSAKMVFVKSSVHSYRITLMQSIPLSLIQRFV